MKRSFFVFAGAAIFLAGCQQTVPLTEDQQQAIEIERSTERHQAERDPAVNYEAVTRAGAGLRESSFEHSLSKNHTGSVEAEADRTKALPSPDLLTKRKRAEAASKAKERATQRRTADRSFYAKPSTVLNVPTVHID